MANGPYSDAQLARLGAAVQLPRARFAEIYDTLAVAKGGDPLKVVQALAERDRTPYFAALSEANRAGWFRELTLRLLHAEAFPDTLDEAIRVELQAIVDPRAGFVDPAHLQIGVIKATRRVCRITVTTPDKGDVHGTGFLVGPQTVLTAWHVVRDLLDASTAKADSHKQIRATFDELSGLRGGGEPVAMAAAWHLRSSPTHPDESPPASLFDFTQPTPAGFDASLDYALLRLAAPVGRQRGYYTLEAARKPILTPPRTQLTLFQHPGGGVMKIANGSTHQLWPPGLETRLRHSANAMPGSSGGLILDADWQPVALHQCGYSTAAGKPFINGAIPTACILAATNDVAFDAVEGSDPLWRIPSTGEPVLGGEDFYAKAWRLASGDKQILSINGEQRSGKSFRIAMLRAMLGTAEHTVVELGPSERSVEPRALALALLAKAGVPADSATLSVPADAQTAQDGWVRDVLCRELTAHLKAAAGSRTLWLVLDDLDNNKLANTASRQLLDTLYGNVANTPFLRIVLIGLKGLVPGAPLNKVDTLSTVPLTLDDVVRYIHQRTVEQGDTRSDRHVAELAAMVLNAARAAPSPFVPAVADAVKLLLEPILAAAPA